MWRRWWGIKNILYVVVRQWDGVENKTTVAIYAGGALTALWLSSTLVGAINTLPLVCFGPASSTPLTADIPCCSSNSHLFFLHSKTNLIYVTVFNFEVITSHLYFICYVYGFLFASEELNIGISLRFRGVCYVISLSLSLSRADHPPYASSGPQAIGAGWSRLHRVVHLPLLAI